MLLTERQLRKIIRQTLVSHSDAQDFTMLQETAKQSNILITTTQGSGYVRFGALLERADQGLLSARQLSIILENDLRNIQREIINEGLLDLIGDAYESVSGGVTKLKDNISDTVARAMESINTKFIEWTTKVWMVMQKGKEYLAKGLGLIKKAMVAIKKFKNKHPILYKVIVFTLIVLLLFALMMIFSNPAAAEVQVGGKRIGDDTYNATMGLLKDFAREADTIAETEYYFKAMEGLEKAHMSGNGVDISQLGSASQKALEAVNATVAEARAAGPGTAEFDSLVNTLNHFAKIGKTAHLEITSTSGVRLTAPMGI